MFSRDFCALPFVFYVPFAVLFACEEPLPGGSRLDRSSPLLEPTGPMTSSQGAVEARPAQNESGCRPTQFWGEAPKTKTVKLSGNIERKGKNPVNVMIDVVSVSRSKAVYGVECMISKEFSFDVPIRLGDVWLFAFVDKSGDGPSRDDLQGRSTERVVDQADLDGILISMSSEVVSAAFNLAPPGAASTAPGPADKASSNKTESGQINPTGSKESSSAADALPQERR